MWAKNSFYQEVVEYPERVLQEKIADFEKKWMQFENDYKNIHGKVTNLEARLGTLYATVFSKLQEGLEAAQNYTVNSDVTKKRVAQLLTSENIYSGLNELKVGEIVSVCLTAYFPGYLPEYLPSGLTHSFSFSNPISLNCKIHFLTT